MKPTAFQERVLTIPETWSIFLGGGRGGGKTVAALFLILRHCQQYGKDAKVLIVRESYPSIRQLTDDIELLFIQAYGRRSVKVNRADHVIRLANGAIVELGQVDSQQAYHRYQGRSFSFIFVDEAGAFADLQWVELLRSNLRAPIVTRVVWAGNPGGPSHLFLHKSFVCKSPPWKPFEHEGITWVSAPSILSENPHLPKRYADDIRSAARGDDELIRAWQFGDWDIARGSFFASVIDERIHMMQIRPEKGKILGYTPKQWRLFISMDWGSSAPSCVFLCGRSPGLEGVPAGSLILIDEVHSASPDDPNKGLKWPPAMLAEVLTEMCHNWGLYIIRGVGDDAYGIDESLLELFRKDHSIYLDKPRKTRVSGWEATRELLFNAKEENGRPGMYVNDLCSYWWETVPFLPRDPRRPEDVNTAAADHSADCMRYAVMHTPNTITSIPW